jgi:hypothetical protein
MHPKNSDSGSVPVHPSMVNNDRKFARDFFQPKKMELQSLFLFSNCVTLLKSLKYPEARGQCFDFLFLPKKWQTWVFLTQITAN